MWGHCYTSRHVRISTLALPTRLRIVAAQFDAACTRHSFERCSGPCDGIGPVPSPRATFTRVPDTDDLLRSHSELRAALILAGKRIRKLNFGKRDDPVLPLLRRVLRESRMVARAFKQK
jgi:hypothetical protein